MKILVCEDGTTYYRDATKEEIKRFESEKEQPYPKLPSTQEQQAVLLMRFLARTAATIQDAVALSIPDILPTWGELLELGDKIKEGVCLMKDGQCYRVTSSGGVTPQAHQPPGEKGCWLYIVPLIVIMPARWKTPSLG